MNRQQVIERIKEVARQVLPVGSSVWLYGSRARGDEHKGSDWDLLVVLDKDHLSLDDYRKVLPLNYLGWDIGEEVNPQVYARKEWDEYSYTLFHDNVERDKMVLI